MLDKPIPELKDKNIALVAMGQSQIDYQLGKAHRLAFDEDWAINAMVGDLPEVDREFIMDPISRFV